MTDSNKTCSPFRRHVIEINRVLRRFRRTTGVRPAKPKERSHSLKLFKRRSRLQIRANFFSNRVVDIWNSLPESVVQAPSLNCFKRRLNKYWHNHPSKFHPACYVPGQNSRRTIQMCQEEAVMPDLTPTTVRTVRIAKRRNQRDFAKSTFENE